MTLEIIIEQPAMGESNEGFERLKISHHILIMLISIPMRHPRALVNAALGVIYACLLRFLGLRNVIFVEAQLSICFADVLHEQINLSGLFFQM